MLTAFFSPTGTTRKIMLEFTAHLNENLGSQWVDAPRRQIDFTPLSERSSTDGASKIIVDREDLFVLGVPVYAGRVPNILLPYLNRFSGKGTKTIVIAVYGNRHYDDALMELTKLLESNGFDVIAAAAFIGEHAFSKSLASGRPDAFDFFDCRQFAHLIADKLTQKIMDLPKIPGKWPLRPYYRPVDEAGNYFDFKRITPVTYDNCIECSLCASFCPMQAISYSDFRTITGICIKCCACVKRCPADAKQFDDPNFIKHKKELEINYESRRTPEFFL